MTGVLITHYLDFVPICDDTAPAVLSMHPAGSGKTTVSASLAGDEDIHRRFGKEIHWVRIRGDAPDRAAEISRAQEELLKALRHHSTRPDGSSHRKEPKTRQAGASPRCERVSLFGKRLVWASLRSVCSPPFFASGARADQSPPPKERDRGDTSPQRAETSPQRGAVMAAAAAAFFGKDAPEAAAKARFRLATASPQRASPTREQAPPPPPPAESPDVSPERSAPQRPERGEEAAWQSVADGIREEMSRKRCLVIVDECPDAHTLETFTGLARDAT